MNYKPGIIVQARTGSSRLPDKVVRPFYKGRSILQELLRRFKDCPDYKLVVATTIEPEDERICELCQKESVPFFRGPVDNVLERFYQASTEYNIDPLIRVCSDNPFLLQSSPGDLLEQYRKEEADYIGYRLSGKRVGIKTHFGLWAELISRSAISKVLKQASASTYLEHVTNFLYEREDQFRISYLNAPEIVYSREDLRLTIDSDADFNLGRSIYEQYFEGNKHLVLEYLVAMIDRNHKWKEEMSKSIVKNEK